MARQNTLNVSLTAPLRAYVNSKVKSGRYESASEVIRDSLRALQERERAAASFWSDVREKVAIAQREVEAGETVDADTAMDEIITELQGHEKRPSRNLRARG